MRATMHIALIARPEDDLMESLRAGVSRLREEGHEVTPYLTFEGGDAERYTGLALRTPLDLLMVAGGDGTVNEVVNGLAKAERAPTLVVVPCGTANDFAAGLDLPEEPEAAMWLAVEGRPVSVDVARVNDRRFINVSTGGFGAEATEETGAEAKKLLGPWAYVITGVRKFAALRPATAAFRTPDGPVFEGEVMLFAVGNARQTGGGSRLTPRAQLGDGKLDVVIVPGMSRVDFIAMLPDLRSGKHLERSDVVYLQTPELVVDSADDLSVNADGEPVRGPRFHYTIEPDPLVLMVPRESA